MSCWRLMPTWYGLLWKTWPNIHRVLTSCAARSICRLATPHASVGKTHLYRANDERRLVVREPLDLVNHFGASDDDEPALQRGCLEHAAFKL